MVDSPMAPETLRKKRPGVTTALATDTPATESVATSRMLKIEDSSADDEDEQLMACIIDLLNSDDEDATQSYDLSTHPNEAATQPYDISTGPNEAVKLEDSEPAPTMKIDQVEPKQSSIIKEELISQEHDSDLLDAAVDCSILQSLE
eukprot:Filipodium_phascolosomae@DN4220_c0_g1_i1.p1